MTGNSMIDKVLTILVLMATAGALGVFVYTEVIYKKPLPVDSVELAKLKEDQKNTILPESFKLDKIIVNLPSNTTRLRFLDVEMHIVIFKQDYAAVLEEKKAQVNDIIIEVASNMEPDELNSISGKLIFESRVKKKINTLIGSIAVKELFYSKFVVQ